MTPGEVERRRIFAEADGVDRADRGLRVFGPRVGHAVMCPACEGDGVVLKSIRLVLQPVPCQVCNGEGLDPNARQGR